MSSEKLGVMPGWQGLGARAARSAGRAEVELTKRNANREIGVSRRRADGGAALRTGTAGSQGESRYSAIHEMC
jgi:hypothetical protein